MLLDLLIIGLIGWFTVRGLKRGLLLSLTGLVGFVVAAFAALAFYEPVGDVLRAGMAEGTADLLAVAVVFAATTVAFWLGGRMLVRLVRMTKWGAIDRAGGALLGASWAVAWVVTASLIMSVLPGPKPLVRAFESSTLARSIAADAPGWAMRAARADLRDLFSPFVARPERRLAIKATDDYQREPTAERRLFELINEERRARGVATLRWDEQVAVVARTHAADMYARGYFDHRTPEGRSPGQRLRDAGVAFAIAGENLALSPSTGIAHNELMASRAHRADILDRRFTRVGIGVMYGRQGLMVAQGFAG